jgi:flagellar hook protein FlgE
MRDSQNLVFGFGNEVTYNSGTLSSTFCINDDEKDGEDLNIDFTLNSKEIKLTLPDGSNRKTILKALSEELSKNGFENSISKDSITINSQDKFILKSNDDIFPSTAAAVMTFKNEPKGEFEFATPDEFAKEIQTLANTAYAGKTKVDFQNGEFVISNLSNETLNAYALNANNTNENFLTNLGRLGNVVYPKTDAKSLLFNSNSQTFGGKIIDQNGNTDIISFEFTKTKVQNNNISWIGNIKILNDSGVLTETKQEFIFDSTGLLISPKNLTLNAPQNININFNLSSFAKNTTKTTYSFSQDGIEEGYLKDYQIDSNGVISALFSNSRAEALGQIPLFHFQNEQGLDSVGGNLFKETSNSNKAFLYQKDGTYIPGGQIISGSLENSNVNMTTAMTELIVTQKAFSASAKTVTTSDEMIQKAINLKR